MRSLVLVVCVAAVVASLGSTSWALSTDFEEGLGQDGAAIGSYYTGMTFSAASTGQDWVWGDITTANYNVSSWPSGTVYGSGEWWVGANVFAWTGVSGDDGRIDFATGDGTYFQIDYSAYNSGGGTALWLEAYDAGDVLLGTDSGASNTRYLDGNASGMGTLRVDAPMGSTIKYVLLHDTGNLWLSDNLMTDDTGAGVFPEPSTLLLLATGGAGLVGLFRRRRQA